MKIILRNTLKIYLAPSRTGVVCAFYTHQGVAKLPCCYGNVWVGEFKNADVFCGNFFSVYAWWERKDCELAERQATQFGMATTIVRPRAEIIYEVAHWVVYRGVRRSFDYNVASVANLTPESEAIEF